MWKKSLADIAKTRDGYQRTPLMADVGEAVFVNDITEQELLNAVESLRARAADHPLSHMHAAMLANVDPFGSMAPLEAALTEAVY
jgi:hypothetical protein